MLFTLEVLPARKGDCLMLHYGEATDPKLIMIDGGPSKVYTPHLKPRLMDLRKKRNIPANKPLIADMLMVSHLDDDHIRGLLDLTRELITAEEQHKPKYLEVFSLWHNSFDNIIGSTPTELLAQFTSKFGAASVDGEPPSDLDLDAGPFALDAEVAESTLKVLASIKQGAKLRSDAKRLEIPVNPEFDGNLILAKGANDKVEVLDGLDFTIVGPLLPELKKLHEKHQAWLKELKKEGITPDQALAAYVDKSVPNLSSIVTLVETGDASILLTGDARGDKIIEGLEISGRLKKNTGKMHVHILKVPHHGSSNNLRRDFFERITADHYVFSGNGEHGNPERESLEMLLNARGDGPKYTVHLTYPVADIDNARKDDWRKEQTKKAGKGKPVENWSAAKHSIASFLADRPAFSKKFKFIQPGKAHNIDLQDKANF